MVKRDIRENPVGTGANNKDEQKRRKLLALQETLLTGQDSSRKVTLKGDFPEARTADRHEMSKDEKQKFTALVDLTTDCLKNAHDALMNLHEHFGGAKGQSILENTGLSTGGQESDPSYHLSF
jgi:hypothetical protein